MPKVAVSGQRVYEHLRQALLRGELQAGNQLLELELAAALDVSRTPVREALRRLEGDGFVGRQGNSVVVLALEPEDIDDIALVRVEIDTLAARLAMQRATEEHWLALEEVVAAIRRIPTEDVEALQAAHQRFHHGVFAAAFRPRMLSVLENHVLQHLEVTRMVSRQPTSGQRLYRQRLYRQHRLLLDALRGDDLTAAERIARDHAGLNAKEVREVVARRDRGKQ